MPEDSKKNGDSSDEEPDLPVGLVDKECKNECCQGHLITPQFPNNIQPGFY